MRFVMTIDMWLDPPRFAVWDRDLCETVGTGWFRAEALKDAEERFLEGEV